MSTEENPMDLHPVEIASGIKEGIAAGIGTGLAASIGAMLASLKISKSRHAKLYQRVKDLESQKEKDRSFKEVVITSQMTQIDLFQLIIDRQGATCADCPAATLEERDKRTQDIIDAARKGLRKYLGSLA
jgi:hypothetical protein